MNDKQHAVEVLIDLTAVAARNKTHTLAFTAGAMFANDPHKIRSPISAKRVSSPVEPGYDSGGKIV